MQIFIHCKTSSFAVNKYLHTVASVRFLFALNYDARDHELKIRVNMYVSIIYLFIYWIILHSLQDLVPINTRFLWSTDSLII